MDASDDKSVSANPANPASSTSPLRWIRAHVRSLSIVAALLALYACVGFLLLPALARHALTGYIERDLGRRASIGSVSCNPFTLTAQMRDFALREPDGSALVSFRLLRVSASPSSLWHRTWTFSAVQLERPVVDARIGADGVLNLAKLWAPKAQQPSKGQQPATVPRPATPVHWPRLRIAALNVRGGSVRFQDRSRGEPFATTLTPVELSLSDFRTMPQFQSRYGLRARTADGAQLNWSGTLSVSPLASSGQFAVTGVKTSMLAAYMGKALPVTLRGGSADLHGDYRFSAAAGSKLAKLAVNFADVHIRGLQIGGAEGAPWVSLPDIDIAHTAITLPQRHIAIAQVTISGANVEVRRDPNGRINLQRLWGSATAQRAPASAVAPAPTPWTVALQRLAVQGAVLDVEDRSVKPGARLRVGPAALVVRNYSSEGSAPISFELDTGLGASGHLHGSGTVVRSPLRATVRLALQKFDLTALQPYVAEETDLTVYRGDLAAQVQLEYAASPARGQPGMRFTGSLSATRFATRDNVLNADFITGRSVQITGIRYQRSADAPSPDALSIDRVRARGVFGRVIIGANGTLNLSDVLRPRRVRTASARSTSTRSTTRSTTASMPIRIGRVQIVNGTADFTDQSVQPRFSSAILGLKGTISGLSSDPSSRARVQLTGSVNRYAPVSITGQVNLLSAATYTDLDLTFRNIELTTFNPYSGKFAGYSIAQGKLTTQMHYHVENGRLDARHHLVIDQLQFGPPTATKPAVPLPVKLAVALLKDRHGVINIDLPVSGSLADPNFHLGPIIWKVFAGLVRKIVTAPFAWLGSLFGGGQQLAYVDFSPGSAVLAPAQRRKLTDLSKALVARPQLKLDIPLHTLSVVDDVALARAALEQALAAATPAGPAATAVASVSAATHVASAAAGAAALSSPRQMALAALYRQRFAAEPRYPGDAATQGARSAWLERQLLPRFAPRRAQRDALARSRADAVQASVLANPGLSPMRVFLTQQDSGGGPAGSVRMQLELQ